MCRPHPHKPFESWTNFENTLALIGERAREMTQSQLDTLYECVKCIESSEDARSTLECMTITIKEAF